MVHKICFAVMASLVLHTTAASGPLPEKYKLQLKPAVAPTACQLDWFKAIPDFSASRLTASKFHAMCRVKFERYIDKHGSGKIGLGMAQCGAWLNYCNAQGVLPGPHYLFKKEEKE